MVLAIAPVSPTFAVDGSDNEILALAVGKRFVGRERLRGRTDLDVVDVCGNREFICNRAVESKRKVRPVGVLREIVSNLEVTGHACASEAEPTGVGVNVYTLTYVGIAGREQDISASAGSDLVEVISHKCNGETVGTEVNTREHLTALLVAALGRNRIDITVHCGIF